MEVLDAAVEFKKNTRKRSITNREFIPVPFGHIITRDIFSDDDVTALGTLAQNLEENYHPFNGASLVHDGSASWSAWNVGNLDLEVISNIQEKIKTHLRNMLYERAYEGEDTMVLSAFDHLSEILPQSATYYL